MMKKLLGAFEFTRNLLSGKKAYIVGMLTVFLGLLNKDNIMVLNGLGIITIRAGIGKLIQ